MSHITIQTQTISLKAIRQGGNGKCRNINEKIYVRYKTGNLYCWKCICIPWLQKAMQPSSSTGDFNSKSKLFKHLRRVVT